jgi:hypothetical protein
MEDEKVFLLKIKSFQTFQTAHIKAHTPTQMRTLSFLATPFNQLPNKFVIFDGGGILKVI